MPPKKRARDEPPADPLAPDVLLIVGPERVELQAHALSLSTASDFFKSALHGGLQESATRTIELPDYDVDDIKLLLAILAYEAFIDPDNVARLGRLFNRLSMSAALRKKAEDLIIYTIDHLGHDYIKLPGNDHDLDKRVELLKLAVDANFTTLLQKEQEDGTMGDGDAMALVRSRIQRGNVFSSVRERIWPSLGELADFRYHEYFSSLWPDIRNVILSPAQLETDDMKEPPSAEVAGYMWPALVQSAKLRDTLEATKNHCHNSLREALEIPGKEYRETAMVRKHLPSGRLGPNVTLAAVSTKFAQKVEKEMPGFSFRW